MNVDAQVLDALAERVALKIVEHSRSTPEVRYVDAAGVATYLSVSAAFVYEHSDELGATRLGNGPRARLRFDLRAVDAWAARKANTDKPEPVSFIGPVKRKPRPRKRVAA